MRIADVWVGVKADLSDFRRGMAELNRNVSAGATAIGQTLSTVGRSMQNTGRAMTSSLTLPILALGGATAKMALDFSKALTQVVSLTDVTAAEIGGIREEILKLAPAIGKSPQELAEAFYFLASAGFDAKESMEVLTIAASASAAGLGETQTVARTIGAVVNAYGKENITAARATDILVAAIGKGTAEAPEFAQSIGQVVGSAAQIGASFEDVAAAIAALTLTGLDASEATVSLNQAFVTLFKPTTEGAEALEKYGLSAAELRAQIKDKGLLSVLTLLAEKFDGDAEATAAVFGNVRALRAILALTGPAAEKVGIVFEDVAHSTGSLNEAVSTYLASPAAALNQSLAKLQVVAIQLGEDVLPVVVDVLSELASAAKEVGKWWKSLDADTRKQIVQWAAWVAIAGPALLIVGKLVSGLGALFKAVGFLTKGIPLLITKVKGLSAAMLGIAGLPLLLWAASEAFRGLGEDVRKWPGMPEEFQDKSLFSIWTEGIDDASTAVSDFAGSMNRDWSDAWLDLEAKTIFGGRAVAGAAKDAVDDIPTDIAATLEDGQYVVGPAAEVMVDPIAEALQKAKEDAATKAKEIIDALISGLFVGKQDLTDAWAEILEIINHPYPDLVRRADLEGKLTATALFDGLHSKDSLAQAKTAEFMLGLISQYETLEPGALAAGELVNPALQAGIDRNLDALVTWIQQTALPGITNPFDLADELELMGYEGLAGYVRGLEVARLGLLGAPVALARRDVKAGMLIDLYGEGYNSAKTYGAGFSAGATAVAIPAVQKFGGKIKGLLGVMSEPKDPDSPLRGITKWGPAIGHTIAEGIKSTIPEIARAVGGVGSLLPAFGTMAPSFSGMALATTGVSAGGVATTGGGDTYITNNYLDIQGEKPVVSTAAEIAEQAARLGRFRG